MIILQEIGYKYNLIFNNNNNNSNNTNNNNSSDNNTIFNLYSIFLNLMIILQEIRDKENRIFINNNNNNNSSDYNNNTHNNINNNNNNNNGNDNNNNNNNSNNNNNNNSNNNNSSDINNIFTSNSVSAQIFLALCTLNPGLWASAGRHAVSGPTARWLNVWCILYTHLETLQGCRSRRRIGWIIQDFWETCVSHSLMFRLETKLRWRQTHSRKKKAIVFTNCDDRRLSESTKRWSFKVCEIFKVCGNTSESFSNLLSIIVATYPRPRNVTLNEMKRPHGLDQWKLSSIPDLQPSVWRFGFARLEYMQFVRVLENITFCSSRFQLSDSNQQ